MPTVKARVRNYLRKAKAKHMIANAASGARQHGNMAKAAGVVSNTDIRNAMQAKRSGEAAKRAATRARVLRRKANKEFGKKKLAAKTGR